MRDATCEELAKKDYGVGFHLLTYSLALCIYYSQKGGKITIYYGKLELT